MFFAKLSDFYFLVIVDLFLKLGQHATLLGLDGRLGSLLALFLVIILVPVK